jgi:hypothetical protein
MSNEETKYRHHSLNVDPAMKAVAEEVAEEAGIQIEFKAPLWGPKGSKNYPENLVGVYCDTEREAEQFSVAFAIRRWEDSKSSGGE